MAARIYHRIKEAGYQGKYTQIVDLAAWSRYGRAGTGG